MCDDGAWQRRVEEHLERIDARLEAGQLAMRDLAREKAIQNGRVGKTELAIAQLQQDDAGRREREAEERGAARVRGQALVTRSQLATLGALAAAAGAVVALVDRII